MKARIAIFGAAGLALWLSDSGSAHWAYGQKWPAGSIVMHLQQTGSSGTLLDGTTSWNAVSEGALSLWNPQLNGVQFTVVRDSTAGIALRNNTNNVFWDDDVYGDPFGDAIAYTRWLYRTDNNQLVEADVVFDRKRSWNSYRGNLRAASGGGTLYDLRRVALHEFGHVLGLGHPDEHGQSVTAIMNSRVSNVDAVQTDDINGVRAIYGTPAAAPTTSDTLQANARLLAGQSLTSTNRRYRLLYQSDGNLVLYDDTDRVALWASNTGGTSTGQVLLQGDGNLVIYDAGNAAVFATGTAGSTNAKLVVQNDGNLVLYAADGRPLWDRFNGRV